MAIYLKADGMTGDVSVTQFKNWIHVKEIDFGGVNNQVNMNVGKANDRNNNFPRFGQVTFVKEQDSSSNAFFEAAHKSSVIKTLEFDYVSDSKQPTVYGKCILNNVQVSYFAEHHSENNHRPLEMITVAYNQIQRNVVPIDSTGKAGSQNATGYDLTAAQKM